MLPLRMLSLLLLMFMGLLCDAEVICPPGLLILEPPVVIAEHTEYVTVNCSSTVPDPDLIYWKFRNITIETEDENYVTLKDQHLDWNDTVECGIRLNQSYECIQVADITLYKNPEVSVYTVKTVELSEEEKLHELQCDIFDVAPIQNLSVIWYKGNESVRTAYFEQTTRTPVSESSLLTVAMRKGDPSTVYKCEAQLVFRPNGPTPSAAVATVTLNYYYAPKLKSGLEIQYYSLKMGETAILNCDADGNPPPRFHWARDGVDMTEMGDVFNAKINGSANYTCKSTNSQGSITKYFHINVISITTPPAETTLRSLYKAPDETPAPMDCNTILTMTPNAAVVKYGDSVSINCSASDALGMGWEAEFGGISLQPLPFLTWKVDNLTYWDITPQCYVQRKTGPLCIKKPAITLYKTPDSVSISTLSDGPMLEGREYIMQCNIVNVAPVQNLKMKWYRGEDIMNTEVFTYTLKTPHNVSSRINVTVNRNDNGKDFRCEAELYLGPNGPDPVPVTASQPYTADVHYQPVLQDCPAHYSGLEHVFTIDMLPCKAQGNPLSLHWYYQGKKINTSEPLTKDQSGKYTVEAENFIGKSIASIDITVEYGPSYACNENVTVVEKNVIQPKCKPEGIPTPNLTWFKNGKEMASTHQWTKHDSGYYELRATNKHGNASHPLYVDVLFAPVIKENSLSMTVTPGQNVTFYCHAEGNPLPHTTWNITSSVVNHNTGGHYNNISFTVGTSTNVVYACTATNKVGSTSIYVTLIIRDTHAWYQSLPVISISIVIAIIIIITIAICFAMSSKKHGQYSFIRANGDTQMPMTPVSGVGA